MALLDNPEFRRLLRSKLRLKSLLMLGTASVVLSLGLTVLFYYLSATSRTPALLWRGHFMTLTVIQLLAFSIYAVTLASHNIVLERERRTYDFQRLVSMGPSRLAFGKLFGAPCEAWWALLCSLPFTAVPVMAGAVPPSVLLQTWAMVIVWATFAGALGLTASSIAEKSAKASSAAVALTGIYLIFSYMVEYSFGRGMTLWKSADLFFFLKALWEKMSGNASGMHFAFAGVSKVPILPGFLVVQGLFIGVLFAVIARRLTDKELSFLSLRHAGLAFGLFEFLLVGSLWKTFKVSPHHALAVFHGINALVLLALAFALTASPELLLGRLNRARRDEHWKVFLEVRNRLQDSPAVAAMACFALAYAVLALALTWWVTNAWAVWTQHPSQATSLAWGSLAVTVMVASLGVAMAALLLYLQVYTERGGLRIGLALLTAALLLPPIILAVLVFWGPFSGLGFGEAIAYVSPVGHIIAFAGKKIGQGAGEAGEGIGALWSCPLICLVAAVLFSVLDAMRLRYLLDIQIYARQHELKKLQEASRELPEAQAAARAQAASLPAAPEAPPPVSPVPPVPPDPLDAPSGSAAPPTPDPGR